MRQRNFIESLRDLSYEEDIDNPLPDVQEQRNRREGLAKLRGLLRNLPGDRYRAAQFVAPALLDEEDRTDRWFYLIGGLYAYHPRHESDSTKRYAPSLGAALSRLGVDEEGKRLENTAGMDGRVMALLGMPVSGLPTALRQAVSLLKQKDVGLNYEGLLDDLCNWDHPENYVQMKWAKDYFRAGTLRKAAPTKNDSTDTDDTENNDESESNL